MVTAGVLAAFLSSVTWAFGSSVYSKLTTKFTAPQINFSRAFFALPIFLSFTLIQGHGLSLFAQLTAHHLTWLMVSMVSSYLLGDGFFLVSTQWIGVPTALAIASSYPIWTAMFSVVFENQHLLNIQIAGLLISVIGVILVILFVPNNRELGHQVTSRHKVFGFFLAFLTSLFWALNSYSVAKGGEGISPMLANTIRMLIALGLTSILGKMYYKVKSVWLPIKVLRKNAFIFIFEAFGGSFFFVYGLSHAPLAIASTLSSLAPVLSVPIAWILKTEKVSLLRFLGIGLVVLGISMLMQST